MSEEHTAPEAAEHGIRTAGLLFGAPWCPVWPVLAEKLTHDDPDLAPLVLVDIDKDPHLADRYLIVSLPTLVGLVDGKEVGRLSGAFTPNQASGLLRRAARKPDKASIDKNGARR